MKERNKKKLSTKHVVGITAVVLTIIIIAAVIFLPKGVSHHLAAYNVLAEAVYPEMAPYPDETNYIDEDGNFDSESYNTDFDVWYTAMRNQKLQENYAVSMTDYMYKSMNQFLTTDNEESNIVFSPLNVYIALSMLAEVTDGESRQQILEVLGQKDLSSLRKQASDLWNGTYRKDGAVTSVLANSIWLNEGFACKEETMKSLAEYYYASAYQGQMGSEQYDKALQEWLNKQTGGLLENQTEQIKMDPAGIMTLASTVFFQSKWQNEYNPDNTSQGVFSSPNGEKSVDYMKDSDMGSYYWSDTFSAMKKALDTEGNNMWFLLPDEDISINELIKNEDIIKMILNPNEWNDQTYIMINETVPKFDITSELELSEGLKELGIRDVFHPGKGDFSRVTEEITDIYLSKAQHDCRVAIDEEGVTAAAYTVMALCGSGMPQDEVDFVLNRPFVFVITNPNHVPIFAGIVNQPN